MSTIRFYFLPASNRRRDTPTKRVLKVSKLANKKINFQFIQHQHYFVINMSGSWRRWNLGNAIACMYRKETMWDVFVTTYSCVSFLHVYFSFWGWNGKKWNENVLPFLLFPNHIYIIISWLHKFNASSYISLRFFFVEENGMVTRILCLTWLACWTP